jgi:hypothetical protein
MSVLRSELEDQSNESSIAMSGDSPAMKLLVQTMS